LRKEMVGFKKLSTIIHNKGGCHMIQLNVDHSGIIKGKSVTMLQESPLVH